MFIYGWPFINYEEITQILFSFLFFKDFYTDPVGPGGHPVGSRTDSRGEKHKIIYTARPTDRRYSLSGPMGPYFTQKGPMEPPYF